MSTELGELQEANECVSFIDISGDVIDQTDCAHTHHAMQNCSDVKCVINFQTWNGNKYNDYEKVVKKSSCKNKSHFRWMTLGVTMPITLKAHQNVMNETLSEANDYLKVLKNHFCQ